MHASPAIGRFGRGAPGVVVVANAGVFPQYSSSCTVMWLRLDSGAVLHERQLGFFAMSSPLVADLNGDGNDETVVVVNNNASGREIPFVQPTMGTSTLRVIDGATFRDLHTENFASVSFATPVLGDSDGDGFWDLVHVAGDGQLVLLPLPYPLRPSQLASPFLRYPRLPGP
jgi:hypothetical protein